MEQEFMCIVPDINRDTLQPAQVQVKALPYVINTIIANIPEDKIRRLNSIIESHNGQPPESVYEDATSTIDEVDFSITIVDGCIHYAMFICLSPTNIQHVSSSSMADHLKSLSQR